MTVNVLETLLSISPDCGLGRTIFFQCARYPQTVIFHQDRLWLADLGIQPSLVFSVDFIQFWFGNGTGCRSYRIWHFLGSSECYSRRFSGRPCGCLTSGAEWMVTGDPLTFGNVRNQASNTELGRWLIVAITPIDVDGATLLLHETGKTSWVCLYWSGISVDGWLYYPVILYNAWPVSIRMVTSDVCYFWFRDDGKFATLTVTTVLNLLQRGHCMIQPEMFCRYQLQGMMFLVDQTKRAIFWKVLMLWLWILLLRVRPGRQQMSGAGLDHLDGENNNCQWLRMLVFQNSVIFPGRCDIGWVLAPFRLGYRLRILLNPCHGNITDVGSARAVRLVEPIQITEYCSVATWSGAWVEWCFIAKIGKDGYWMLHSSEVSGDIRIPAFGWNSMPSQPLWRIEQKSSLPFALLSVHMIIIANR